MKTPTTKTYIENLFLLPALIAGLGLIAVERLTAQTYTNLHSFTGNDFYAKGDLILSGTTLYGTTMGDGNTGYGQVFKVNTNGTGYTRLHIFDGFDGGFPEAGLILSGNTLYGTTSGYENYGTVFAINTDGTGFRVVHVFDYGDGAWPRARLILSGDILYGTTTEGGGLDNGTVFAVNTNGTGFTNLHNFTTHNGYTNSDGAYPRAGLILSGNTLYGTTGSGGSSAQGTAFAVNINGSGFTNLHSFNYFSDGAFPQAELTLSGNTLYGTTFGGGNSGNGTVFALNTNGTGFTNLYSFTNSAGANPRARLILSGGALYGTAANGGTGGAGTVFAVKIDGTGFSNLHNFNPLVGGYPVAGLILSGTTLYGATSGTVFSLSLPPSPPPPPQLTIIRSGANFLLKWATNTAGFTLQSTTNLVSPAVWITNFPAPVTINGQNTVTNPAVGAQKFFRLKSQ